jgi:hypothetical protein
MGSKAGPKVRLQIRTDFGSALGERAGLRWRNVFPLDLAALIAVYADMATAQARTGEVISPVSDFN